MPSTNVTLTITTPAGLTIPVLMDTLATYWGYTGFLTDNLTPETKAAFMQRKIAGFVRESYIAAKAVTDAESARAAAAVVAGAVTVT